MRRDTMWGCLGVLLLVGAGIVIGYFGALAWAAPQQTDARAAVTPEKPALSASEVPTLQNTLDRARINARSCVEELEQVQLPSHSPVVVEGE